MDLQEKILELLAKEDAMKSVEIAEALGVDKKNVDKAIKQLKADEKIISPKRCFYSVNK
ncbi:winged helix-turn-helix transcriptional regulator [Clostridium cibarium]|uniref:Winged helix-turn-helix transcriptional regulator n=1 Tax=Clostridium cibarium TaxID=2762247 RepID=A0ABR8PXE4_9CLOT|nr:winged helix-turn-helix transcriptional regulator [Clostridium cibarium]MBD7912845.1 winged helix-turn-helix transcriptional regulator [Clostridium cibarium]